MKDLFLKSSAALILVVMCLTAFAGCTSGEPAQSETEKTVTAAATTESAVTAEIKTEPQTEEQTTEAAVTEAPAVLESGHIDIRAALEHDIKSYFTKAKYCVAGEAEDAEEGKVITLSTDNIKKVNLRSPYVYFKYAEFCASLGMQALDLSQKTFVVLKIKAEGLNDRLFTLTASASEKDNETVKAEVSSKIPGGDGWHYVVFDFSKASKASQFTGFRLAFEQLAAKDGESVSISKIIVCDKEEAEKYKENDVYPAEEQTAGDYTLSLLQFNIQTENGNPAPFIVRSEMYRKFVDEIKPDVVGMEEVTTNWRNWLDTYVFNDSYAGVGEPRTNGGEANPIYYRKDKFELVDSGTFWLSDTPDKVGSSLQGANYPRICTWVILKDKATGVQFAHMNTHLDHNGNNDSTTGNNIRKAQMAVIVKFAAEKFRDMPQFLTGDLNNRRTTSKGEIYALYKMITGEKTVTEEGGTTYKMSLADSRLNASVTVDENHTATMTKYYDETNSAYEPTREPIDYAFYNPANTEALTYETFLMSENGCWISDHLPVFATFRIN